MTLGGALRLPCIKTSITSGSPLVCMKFLSLDRSLQLIQGFVYLEVVGVPLDCHETGVHHTVDGRDPANQLI